MKRYELRFRPRAEAHLVSIYVHIRADSGDVRAWNVIERIQTLCENLVEFPERGRSRPEIAPGIRTISLDRMATVAYRVTPDAVEIVAVAWAGLDIEQAWGEL